MLVPAPAEMTQQPDPITIIDPGANNTAVTNISINANLAAVSRRHAPGRWAYSADTLTALSDAATAADEARARAVPPNKLVEPQLTKPISQMER